MITVSGGTSFQYVIRRVTEGAELTICQYRWGRFLSFLFWSTLSLLLAYLAFNHIAWSYLWFLLFALGGLLTVFGLYNVVRSIRYHELTLTPSGIRMRTFFFGIATSRMIDLRNVSAFGLARLGHSGTPIFRLEERCANLTTKWTILATGVRDEEVNALLLAAQAQGIQLPR
jgi:hypothetical protein